MTRPISEALSEVFDRIKAIADTPEYQAHASRLQAEEAEDRKRQAETARRYRLKSTGVPPEVAVEGFQRPTMALAAVQEFLNSPPACRFLMLGGKAGNGKTFAIASAVWDKGGRYVDAQELVRTSTFDDAEWDRLAATPLLAVDELGAEATNSAFEANLYNLLDRRYRTGKRTLIATNLNAQEFKARFCENGLDRMLDRLGTGGRWVTLADDSMRQKWNAAVSP